MISRDTYLKLRAMGRRYEAARKQFDPKRYGHGGGYDKKDVAAISSLAGTRDLTNEERAQIEEFEWKVFPPSRYFAYYDENLTKITNWTGIVLGRIVWRGNIYRDSFGGKRCNIVVRGTNNVMYAGTCNMSSGNYCRLKRIKGKPYGPGVLPNAKKSHKRPAPKRPAKRRKPMEYERILDYYAGLRRNPVKKAKHFMVVAVSKNANSFGLRGMVLMARDGEAWQVGASHLHVRQKGDIVRVPASAGPVREASWVALGYEIPEKLPPPPARVVSEVWG